MEISSPLLIVGFGSIGRRHVNNLLKITNSPIIIFSKRKGITANNFINYRKNKNRIKIFSDLNKCLEEKPIAAFITNETSFHIDYALKLAKKRLDLFIEKPLSDSLKNISNLSKIVKKNKIIVMVGCNFRFYPPIRKMKELTDKKLIGKIISVQSENGSYLPDWHPYEDYSKGYAARKDLGGGVALTQIHELDYLTWIFGNPVLKKTIMGKYSELRVNADDLCASILELENKIIIELHLDYFSRPFYKRLKIRGTDGILYWNSIRNEIKVYWYQKQKWEKIVVRGNYKLTKNVNRMYVEELNHFLDCLIKRKHPMNDLDEATKVLSTVLEMKHSR